MAGPNQQQKQDTQGTTDVMGALAAAGLSTDKGSTATIAEYFALQLAEKREQMRLKALAEEQDRRVRREGAEAAEKERKAQEVLQKVCPHRSEDGKPKTGGVRSLNGHMGVTCGLCRKSWEGTEPELRGQLGPLFPPNGAITGPIQQ